MKVTAQWLRLDGPHCIFGRLIVGKIIKIIASRGQILRLICAKFYFGRVTLQCSPRSLAGPTSKGRDGRRRKGKGGERKGGKEWKGGKVLLAILE